jgi:hypothetical protein
MIKIHNFFTLCLFNTYKHMPTFMSMFSPISRSQKLHICMVYHSNNQIFSMFSTYGHVALLHTSLYMFIFFSKIVVNLIKNKLTSISNQTLLTFIRGPLSMHYTILFNYCRLLFEITSCGFFYRHCHFLLSTIYHILWCAYVVWVENNTLNITL